MNPCPPPEASSTKTECRDAEMTREYRPLGFVPFRTAPGLRSWDCARKCNVQYMRGLGYGAVIRIYGACAVEVVNLEDNCSCKATR